MIAQQMPTGGTLSPQAPLGSWRITYIVLYVCMYGKSLKSLAHRMS